MITNYVYEIVGLGVGEINSISPNNLLLIYSKSNASGASEFTELLDAPNSYTGQAGKVVKVNSAETGLEFDDEAGGVGTLQQVTENGNETDQPIVFKDINAFADWRLQIDVGEFWLYRHDGSDFQEKFRIETEGISFFDDDGNFKFWLKKPASGTSNLVAPETTGEETIATEDWALQRDGSNANSDVDLGVFNLNAKGVKINGTAGDGHLGLKHQSTNATAGGQETVIFAGNDGEPRYKNDGGAIEQFASRAWVLAQGFLTSIANATASVAGIAKLYTSTGNNTDGSMTQKAVTDALDTKENTIPAGTTGQYYRGDKTFQTLNIGAVSGLQTALDAKFTKSGDTITGDIGNTSTGFFRVASGTTAQRPVSPLDGMLRYNSDLLRHEFYSNGAWRQHIRLEAISDISLTSTIVGWASFTTRYIGVLDLGYAFLCIIDLRGVSNNSTTSITVPFTNTGGTAQGQMRVENAGTFQNTPGLASIVNNSNVINFFLNNTAASFTNSGNKSVVGQILIYKTT